MSDISEVQIEGEFTEKQIKALQAEYDSKCAEIDEQWGDDDKGHYVERYNLAREYADHRDELGNFVVEGVTEYIDPNESPYEEDDEDEDEDEDVDGTDF